MFVTPYADLGQLAAWVLRQNGRARPLEPEELVAEVGESLARVVVAHTGPAPEHAAEVEPELDEVMPDRPAGPVPPERFAVLQALLAHLLSACGDSKRAVIPAAELLERFPIPEDQLDEHLQLLNLVNFGGGCYAVYAVLEGDNVRVDKELFGDAFRRPPRLTPLEARAIRLAIEFVGPMLAPAATTPLERVREKLERTFGQFELRETPEPALTSAEEELIRTLSRAIAKHRLVQFEYLKQEDDHPATRVVEPYFFERRLPNWYLHVWDRERDAARSFRLDRMRNAQLLEKSFEPRPSFAPQSSKQRTVQVLFSEDIARWRLESGARRLGARPLADGTALEELAYGSEDWLVGEVLSFRGAGTVLGPKPLRTRVARRARVLQRELSGKARSRR